MVGIIDSLYTTVLHLRWIPEGTEWADYYNETNYTHSGLEHKKELIRGYLKLAKPCSVWDLGANVGLFSRLASKDGIFTAAFELDPACAERNYLDVIKHQESNLLPLVLDLTNPSPSIGWDNEERASLIDRGPVDMVLALALIHHLAIANNLPFDRIAKFLARICDYLVVEFVPKADSQVKKILANREDIFEGYNQVIFEQEFSRYFVIIKKETIVDSLRTLYLMRQNFARDITSD